MQLACLSWDPEKARVKNIGIKQTWVQVIALPHHSSMTLGKLLNLFGLCFLTNKLRNLIELCLKYTWSWDLVIFHYFYQLCSPLEPYELP